MTMVAVRDIRLQAGAFELRGVSLNVDAGEYFVLMGPTGSGKSLLVKCICGLIRPLAGTVTIANVDVTRAEPRHRRVGYVPQDSGLFPHMNVARNLTFPLRVAPGRRSRWLGGAGTMSHKLALTHVAPIIEMLSLAPLLDRSPSTLSGGERQKIAVGRALASNPKLMVLDEPVSALDEPTRRETCRELRRVQQELGVPTIHICHNVAEAEIVADRVGVLLDGRLVQTGALADLLREPAEEGVARLLKA